MKILKRIILLFTVVLFSSCMVNKNYPLTTFYVKNTTGNTLNFKASIVKYSSMGPFEMTLPFSVPPHDSVIARKVGFNKNIAPTKWFTRFTIFPTDSVKLNDPNTIENWVKSTDVKGNPVYTFIMTK